MLYAKGCEVNSADTSGFADALRLTAHADTVILVVGDRSGLTLDCTTGESRDRANLGLPGAQEELVKQVLAQGKPTIVVFISGRPVSSPYIAQHAPAILNAWLPGEEGATAIAEALFGQINPGGKLPVTIVRDSGQIPLYYNHKPSGGKSRWHGDYVDLLASPLFPFGHGLSYTQFMYSDLAVSAQPSATIPISLTITNIGPCAGDEVVQLYTRDLKASLPRPVKELRAFQRLTLQPSESKRLTFHLNTAQLAFYTADLQLMLEPGEFEVMVGSSSADIRLRGHFALTTSRPQRVASRVYRSDCV